jgi:hypothetical protein
MAEKKTLHFRTSLRSNNLKLFCGLDSLSRGCQPETGSQQGDRAYYGYTTSLLRKIPDERAVYFDLVERETTQIAKRGIACSEVVHRNPCPKSPQFMKS